MATNASPQTDLSSENDLIAVKQLAALAHIGRLGLFKSLIQAGSQGLSAGELARSADIGATTASAQLLILSNASLVSSQRQGRQVIYQANYQSMAQLMRHLLENCCQGRCEILDQIGDSRGSQMGLQQ